MAAALSVIVAKDGAGSTVVGGLQYLDLSGAATGPWVQTNVIVDGSAGTTRARVGTAALAMSTGYVLTALASDSPGITTLGQTTMSASLPVVPASNYTQGYTGIATWTEGTAAYAASDLLGTGAGNAALTFANAARGAGEHLVTSVSLMINRAALISGETSYILYLYNVTPPSNIATSALFQLTATDQAAFLDAIAIPTLTVTGTSTNSTLFGKVDGINKQITAASSSIFGYLMSVGAYTPTAVAATVTIHTVAV